MYLERGIIPPGKRSKKRSKGSPPKAYDRKVMVLLTNDSLKNMKSEYESDITQKTVALNLRPLSNDFAFVGKKKHYNGLLFEDKLCSLRANCDLVTDRHYCNRTNNIYQLFKPRSLTANQQNISEDSASGNRPAAFYYTYSK
jgi:hypothetical protein